MAETINQFSKHHSDPPDRVRISSRGLVIENGNVLLSHEVNTGVYMSPGGGLESGDYKITVDVDIYDNSDFSILINDEDTTFPSNNPEGKVLKTDAKGETKTLTAEFTV